ncbi:alkylmercury lyase [Leucobacter chromiiresistens]|uniref:Alkylmercury lyase n=1 Tax=Leucobacter chromiiresistens TaxID=1079994 RepID=A0A1H0YFI1_9MICO|nr:alkylmercury lyase [Leucobacter chromiiresistens]SDQ13957.1 hypothetical protein SAMN04488565_0829 [Leucobacter chromiiresistens]
MEITIQSFDGCPNRDLLEQRLAQALNSCGGDVTIAHHSVETPEDAARVGFRGSPTVLIDGVDPFAEGHAFVGLACRVYRTADGPSGSPSVAQLRAAIKDATTGQGEGSAL